MARLNELREIRSIHIQQIRSYEAGSMWSRNESPIVSIGRTKANIVKVEALIEAYENAQRA